MSPLFESLRPRRARRGTASATFAYFRIIALAAAPDCRLPDAKPMPSRCLADASAKPARTRRQCDGDGDGDDDGAEADGLGDGDDDLPLFAACCAASSAAFILAMSCP